MISVPSQSSFTSSQSAPAALLNSHASSPLISYIKPQSDNYHEIKIIGHGNFGFAHLVRDQTTGKKVVIKKIHLNQMTEQEKAEAYGEITLLSSLSHQNIITYITHFTEDNILHLVTSFCNGGDLSELIKTRKTTWHYLDEDAVLDIFIQLAMAVDYCHSLRVMHRDLKTSNVFITRKNVVKLGDFGIAKMLDADTPNLRTVVGTPSYMSPEVCENKAYDFKSDVWSVGCVLYELCKLDFAFGGNSILAVVQRVVQEQPAPIPAMYSLELCKLISTLLSKDPKERPQIRKVFQIPFIRQRLESLANSTDLPDLQPDPPQVPLPPDNLKLKRSISHNTSNQQQQSPQLLRTKPKHFSHARAKSTEFASNTSPNMGLNNSFMSTPPPPQISAAHAKLLSTLSSSNSSGAAPPAASSRDRLGSEDIDKILVLHELKLRSEGVERFSSEFFTPPIGGGHHHTRTNSGLGRTSRSTSSVTALSLDS